MSLIKGVREIDCTYTEPNKKKFTPLKKVVKAKKIQGVLWKS